MTVEDSIIDLLAGLVDRRVYMDAAPMGEPRPYITFQQVGGVSVTFLERGIPSKKNGRFQVNWWAESRPAAAALGLQIEAAFLTATTVQAAPLGAAVALYEEELELFGGQQDFSIWSDR